MTDVTIPIVADMQAMANRMRARVQTASRRAVKRAAEDIERLVAEAEAMQQVALATRAAGGLATNRAVEAMASGTASFPPEFIPQFRRDMAAAAARVRARQATNPGTVGIKFAPNLHARPASTEDAKARDERMLEIVAATRARGAENRSGVKTAFESEMAAAAARVRAQHDARVGTGGYGPTSNIAEYRAAQEAARERRHAQFMAGAETIGHVASGQFGFAVRSLGESTGSAGLAKFGAALTAGAAIVKAFGDAAQRGIDAMKSVSAGASDYQTAARGAAAAGVSQGAIRTALVGKGSASSRQRVQILNAAGRMTGARGQQEIDQFTALALQNPNEVDAAAQLFKSFENISAQDAFDMAVDYRQTTGESYAGEGAAGWSSSIAAATLRASGNPAMQSALADLQSRGPGGRTRRGTSAAALDAQRNATASVYLGEVEAAQRAADFQQAEQRAGYEAGVMAVEAEFRRRRARADPATGLLMDAGQMLGVNATSADWRGRYEQAQGPVPVTMSPVAAPPSRASNGTPQ